MEQWSKRCVRATKRSENSCMGSRRITQRHLFLPSWVFRDRWYGAPQNVGIRFLVDGLKLLDILSFMFYLQLIKYCIFICIVLEEFNFFINISHEAQCVTGIEYQFKALLHHSRNL
jgi:hypothetical protein